jgi:hypothetical protein
MDIETLISAVQHHPLLWDTTDADYKDKNKKHQAWVEVSKILFEDYDNQSQDQQKLIGEYNTMLLCIVLMLLNGIMKLGSF